MKRYLSFLLVLFSLSCFASSPGDLNTAFGSNGIAYRAGTGQGSSYALQGYCVAVQSDGKIVLAGEGTSGFNMIRFTTAGVLDTTFGTAGIVQMTLIAHASAIIIQPAVGSTPEKIIVVGYTNNNLYSIGRFNLNGTVDTTFSPNGVYAHGYVVVQFGQLYGVVLQPDGQIVVAGYNPGNNNQTVLARYSSTGVLDTTFNTGSINTTLNSKTKAIALQADGKFILVGESPGHAMVVTRFTTSGTIDTTFGINGSRSTMLNSTAIGATSVVLDEDGNIVVGATGVLNGDFHSYIVRFTSSGALDTSYNSPSGYVSYLTPSANASYCNGVAILADGSYLAAGYSAFGQVSGSLLLVCTTKNGIFNSAFGTNGIVTTSVPNTIYLPYNTFAQGNGVTTLPNGDILVVAYVNYYYTSVFNGSQGMDVAYYIGLPPVPSLFDETFGTQGVATTYADGASSPTAEQQVMAVRQLTGDGGKLMSIISDGINSWTVRVDSNGTNDVTYGSGQGIAIEQLVGNETVTQMQLGNDNSLMVIGMHETAGGYVKRVLADGSMDPYFGGFGTDPLGSVYDILTYGAYGVAQLSNGNVIVVGADAARTITPTGSAVMLYAAGTIDTRFAENGLYLNGSSIASVSVDANNNLYFAVGYLDGSTKKVRLVKMNQFGVLDSSFGTGGIVDNVISNIDNYVNIRLALDADDNIVVAASWGETTGKVALIRYTPEGVIDTTFHSGTQLNVTFPVNTTVDLTRLMTLSDGKITISGYQDGGVTVANNQWFIAQVLNDGTLDIDFNSSGDIPGIFTFQVSSDQIAVRNYDAIMQQDGKIVFAGSQSPASNQQIPYLVRILDETDVQPVPQYPAVEPATSLFDDSFGTDGAAIIYANGASSPTAQQQVMAVRQLNDLNLMTVVSDGTNSWSVRVNQNGTNDSTYGAGQGIAIAQVTGNEVVSQLQLTDDSLMIVGTHDGQGGYLKRVLPNGSMDPLFGGSDDYPVGTFYGFMTEAYGVAQLTNGSMVVVGNTAGVGTVAMISLLGAIQPIFSEDGFYSNGNNIASVSVDIYNNLYFAVGYLDGSTKKVRIIKMSAEGVLDSSFGTGGIVNNVISNIDNYVNIRLALDAENNIVVAASWGDTAGKVGVVRYTPAGVLDTTFNSGAQFDIEFIYSAPVFLTTLLTLTNGKITVSGYQNDEDVASAEYVDGVLAADQWFIAQLTNGGGYDLDFNADSATPGLYEFQVNTTVEQLARRNYDAIMQSDGKIVCAGSESPAVDEETPLLVRILDETDVQSVPQYPGIIYELPSPIVENYGIDGIAQTNTIANLVAGGNQVVPGANGSYVGGRTSNSRLVVAALTETGVVNSAFGSTGVATSAVIDHLAQYGSIAIDSEGRILVGAFSSYGKLIAARFTSAGVADITFGTGGVAQTDVITNLTQGGFIAVDSENRVIVGGMSSDSKLVATRFTTGGVVDTTFGSYRNGVVHYGIVKSAAITNLIQGGTVAVDSSDNVFIGGYSSNEFLVIAKFTVDGMVSEFFGTDGIAQTATIADLAAVGSMVIDPLSRPVIGGSTYAESLTVARFTTAGVADTTFADAGVVVTPLISNLRSGGFVAVDNLNRILVSGFASILGDNSMIVARLKPNGILDNSFVIGGIATTGVIADLNQGGFIGVDPYDNIFLGGMNSVSGANSLMNVKLYSGDPIIVPDVQSVPTSLYIALNYGNQIPIFRAMILVDYYLARIENAETQAAVRASVDAILDAYIALYSDKPGVYLILDLFKINFALELAQANLDNEFPDFADEVDAFFTSFNARIEILVQLNPQLNS
ncbi:hypothetical protein KBC04_04050 [Candidatus Babeliales bacterium]|nr:hypothetical protein [Candidatus Babeliales bacterium]MBP9843331.1 hypothetical protein [Candidatus Babeliales bacterium]